jgi:hypothetical protein
MDNGEVVNQDDDAMNANRKPASRRVDDVKLSASPSEDGRANEPGTLQEVKETDIQTTRLLEHAEEPTHRSLQSTTVTSFIVSEKSRNGTTCDLQSSPNAQDVILPVELLDRCNRAKPPADSNIVEPPEDMEINRGGDLAALSTKSSTPSSQTGTLLDMKPETPILAPSLPSPTLVGRVTAGVVSGIWGMTREAALSGDLAKTSKFEYKFKLSNFDTLDSSSQPQSGSYGGYFCLQVPGKTSPVKVVENSMTLEFAPNTAGKLNIRGRGQNRYGPFTISGTCHTDGSALELARIYEPKPPPVPKLKTSFTTQKLGGKDLSRVQAALNKPQHHHTGINVAPVTVRSHKQDTIPALTSTALSSAIQVNSAEYTSNGDGEGKRSGRARKAPSHLRDGSPNGPDPSNVELLGLQTTEALRRCHAIVISLERFAGADWFSAPVDAVALGVPHYGAIIDAPMDLSTVKRGLDCGLYPDPHAFAADMRLVFRNAMTFNVLPEAPVHEAARNLHAKFEDQLQNIWKHIAGGALGSAKFKSGGPKRDADGDLEGQINKRAKIPNGKSGGKKSGKGKKGPRDDDYGALSTGTGMVPVADLVNMQRQMESMQATIAALQKQASQTEVQVQMNMELGLKPTVPGHAISKPPRVSKLLTFDEKEALSNDINDLPPEKLAHVVKIVQESMPLTGRHDDDEIEVDIETLDNDTLRHLQKYVKASLGKKRAVPKKKGQQPLSPPPEITLNSDERTLESVAFGGSGLGPGFESDDDDDLAYDVLGA